MKLLTILFVFAGCQFSHQENLKTVKAQNKTEKIISKRPQGWKHFIGLIRLQGPSLFEGEYSEQRLEEVNQEHAEAIKKLKEISSEIAILYTYKFVLNGLAIIAPLEVKDKINQLSEISYVEEQAAFGRPQAIEIGLDGTQNISEKNSVTFIKADKVHKNLNIKGKGIHVGVLDTGIDYTHAMFGGSGDAEVFKATDPAKPSDLYPNEKVVGGIDLVGTLYDSSSSIFELHIPRPDNNPIDEGGHGSHVAGTVAGLGDGVNTYDGVAPEALLHSIKVFGANGSTGDTVVIAGLEYAADPNGDGNPDDKLDIVNLSLGSPYGKPHLLYREAVKNLVNGGVVFVGSAGNSGHIDYITGAPASVEESMSVAASIDYMDHNWKFQASLVSYTSGESELVEAIEGSISKPISEIEEVTGKLVFIGDAATELTEEQKMAVKGNIALVDRGKTFFAAKLKRVFDAGGIGMILANNKPGDAFAMGGDENFPVPAIMIDQVLGNKIKSAMKKGDVTFQFKTEEKLEKPQLIDTLTGFSSKGPRSYDSLLKPNISAPGSQIISAAMGKGKEGVKFSGTSMAAPHMAGVMALLKQLHPKLTVAQLNALVYASAEEISDKDSKLYPLSQMGAGRVNVEKASQIPVIFLKSQLSLGNQNLQTKKLISKRVSLKSLKEGNASYELKVLRSSGLKIHMPKSVSLVEGESTEIELDILLEGVERKGVEELEAVIGVVDGEKVISKMQILAVAKFISTIKTAQLEVMAGNLEEAPGAKVSLVLKNSSSHEGVVVPFNLLGHDEEKRLPRSEASTRSRNCDLKTAGYRIIQRDGEEIFQVGVKLYHSVTQWQGCELDVLIDANNDGIADQELAGILYDNLPGLSGDTYGSVLVDAAKVRELRASHEKAQSEAEKPWELEEDYTSAIVDLQEFKGFTHSSVAIVETPLKNLAPTRTGKLKLRIGVLNEDRGAVEADDFLGNNWVTISRNAGGQAFANLPEQISIEGDKETTSHFTKGEGRGELILFAPSNTNTYHQTKIDKQLLKPKMTFKFAE